MLRGTAPIRSLPWARPEARCELDTQKRDPDKDTGIPGLWGTQLWADSGHCSMHPPPPCSDHKMSPEIASSPLWRGGQRANHPGGQSVLHWGMSKVHRKQK